MESPHYIKNELKKYGMERKNNNLIIIPKTEKNIEYMPTILLKLPRTEKFSICIEIKTSMYDQIIYFKEYIQYKY